jgi:flagellin
VVQSTEAALGEQANILTRLRELAMEPSSDGLGNAERAYVDTEAQQLLGELQRITQTTEYNGTKLLNGAAITLDFQVGIHATASDVISPSRWRPPTAASRTSTWPRRPAGCPGRRS